MVPAGDDAAAGPVAVAASSPSRDGDIADPQASTSQASPGGQRPSSTSAPSPSAASPPSTTSMGSKRPRKALDDPAAAARGKRMFGLLNATLGQARRQVSDKKDEASRRASIEARTHARLQAEQQEREAEKASRSLLEREIRLVQNLIQEEAAHRSVRSQKRRLASFLVTAYDDSGYSDKVIAPAVPSSLRPLPPRRHASSSSRRPNYPVYFLPNKLTERQEDLLDEQEDRVDAEIDVADRQWEKRKAMLLRDLEALQEDFRQRKRADKVTRKQDTEVEMDVTVTDSQTADHDDCSKRQRRRSESQRRDEDVEMGSREGISTR